MIGGGGRGGSWRRARAQPYWEVQGAFCLNPSHDCTSRPPEVLYVGDKCTFYGVRSTLEHLKQAMKPSKPNNSPTVDLEESWEIGSRYVRQTMLFDANNDIAARLKNWTFDMFDVRSVIFLLLDADGRRVV